MGWFLIGVAVGVVGTLIVLAVTCIWYKLKYPEEEGY